MCRCVATLQINFNNVNIELTYVIHRIVWSSKIFVVIPTYCLDGVLFTMIDLFYFQISHTSNAKATHYMFFWTNLWQWIVQFRGHEKITWKHAKRKSNISSSFPFPWCVGQGRSCIFQERNQILLISRVPQEASGTFVCIAFCSRTGRHARKEIHVTVNSTFPLVQII